MVSGRLLSTDRRPARIQEVELPANVGRHACVFDEVADGSHCDAFWYPAPRRKVRPLTADDWPDEELHGSLDDSVLETKLTDANDGGLFGIQFR